MEPAREKALFDEFLQQAVAEYSMTGGSLQLFTGSAPPFFPSDAQKMWGHVTDEEVQRLELLLGVTTRAGSFYNLTAPHCELALVELIQNPALRSGALLLLGMDISKWLIEGKPVETQSRIHLHYGVMPCISTFLQFQTVEQFQFIKQVLSDLNFCKLNEKHLKPIKRGSR